MPDPEFESWVDSRLSGAYGTPGEQDEFRAVEADRRLRAWARDGGEPAGARKPLADLGSESPIEAMLLEAFFASGFFERFEVPSDVVVGSGPFGLLLVALSMWSLLGRVRTMLAVHVPALLERLGQ